MRLRNWFMSVVGAALVTAAAQTGSAQQVYQPTSQPQMVTVSATSLSSLVDRLDALEQRVATSAITAQEGCGDCGDGWVDTSQQKFTVDFGGRAFMDYVNYTQQNAGSLAIAADAQDYVEFRTLRLFMQGEGYGVVDYRFQLDFEPETGRVDDPAVELRDVYFGLKELPFNSYVRFGHFKAAHGLEQMTDGRYTTFMERSVMDNFAAGRRMGAQYYWESADQNATLTAGAFFDGNQNGGFNQFASTKQSVSDNQGLLLPFRLTYLPIYDEPSGGRYMVHTGLSGYYFDDADNQVAINARPEVHEGPFFVGSPAVAADDLYAITPEFAAVWGPASVQAEYTYVDIEDANTELHSGYVTASYFLTGEHRQYQRGRYEGTNATFARVTPYSNFWIVPGCVGPGAWEVAGRWSYIEADGAGTGISGIQNNFTFGVNWYWNPHVRWMFNYIHSETNYQNPALASAENDIFGIRGQIDW